MTIQSTRVYRAQGKFDAGTVVSYTPDPSRHEPRWCREGIAIADANGRLIDTYWGSGNDYHVLTREEAETAAVLFSIVDFTEIDAYRRESPTWATYAPKDRQVITSQHGLQKRWFIRRGAEPSLATQIANAEAKVEKRLSELASAQRQLDWAREDLAALIVKGN